MVSLKKGSGVYLICTKFCADKKLRGLIFAHPNAMYKKLRGLIVAHPMLDKILRGLITAHHNFCLFLPTIRIHLILEINNSWDILSNELCILKVDCQIKRNMNETENIKNKKKKNKSKKKKNNIKNKNNNNNNIINNKIIPQRPVSKFDISKRPE